MQPARTRGALADGAIAGAGFGVLFIALAQISADAGLLTADVLGERIDTGQRTGIGICTLAVATLALG